MHNDTKIAERTQFKALKSHLDDKEITVLLGPRQVGKTTLMQELREYLVNKKAILEENIFYFNLDVISDLEFFQSQKDIIEFLKERTKDKKFVYLFIDEVQRIKNAGIFIKGIYDLNLSVKMIISGSSSLELKKKIQEPLTGRKKVFLILPFSFCEFLNFKDKKLKEIVFGSGKLLLEEKHKIKSYLNEYIVYGGYPSAVTAKNEEKKKEYLEEIYNSYIEKDIVKFLGVRNPLIFSNLVKILASQNTGMLNVRKIADALNINQRTVEKYIFYLEQTFVIKKLPPFFTNIKKEIVKMPKIYFLDTGLRNFSISDMSDLEKRADKGELLENFAFNELLQKLKLAEKINFWRDKDGHEVDFIVRKGIGVIPFEVKTQEKNLKISQGLNYFLNQYKNIPKGYMVIGDGQAGSIKLKKSSVEFVLAHKISEIDF